MNEQDTPDPDNNTPPTPSDRTGWSQPPAPQSPGPPGAFVDRPTAPPGAPLPPGAGSPVQPGPPLSVQAPIKDTTINVVALVVGAGAVLVAIVIVIIVIGAFAQR